MRVWSWLGNTADSALIRQAKADLREWNLGRVVWVGDRGFTSAANRADLRRGGHAYILGEKLRSGSVEATAALARPGRHATVAGNLQVEEVKIAEGERFIVCFNPDQAGRDTALREVISGKLEALIRGSDALSATKRPSLPGGSAPPPAPYRYLRGTPAGLLRVDRAKAVAEAKLDGKYLLRCSDPSMSAADIALGYKQLIARRTRLAGPEDPPGATAGLPPPGAPHPRPRAAVLAGPAAGPHRRDPHRAYLDRRPRRPARPARRGVHWPGRHLHPDQHSHPRRPRRPHRPRRSTAEEDPRPTPAAPAELADDAPHQRGPRRELTGGPASRDPRAHAAL